MFILFVVQIYQLNNETFVQNSTTLTFTVLMSALKPAAVDIDFKLWLIAEKKDSY